MDINKPILYGSNQILVDQNLVFIGKRFDEKPHMDLLQLITENNISGCTMVMNKELRDILIAEKNIPSKETTKLRLHDTWCMIVATIYGQVIYDNEAFIMYRQHESNVVGAKTLSWKEKCIDKLNRLQTKKYKGARSRLSREIIDKFGEDLKKADRLNIETISNCNSIQGGVALCLNKRVRRTFKENDIELFLKCIRGWI